jgi:hypothetical protein
MGLPPQGNSHGAAGIDAGVIVIGPIGIGRVAPGIDAPIGAACRFLPRRFAQQADLPAFIA